MRSTLALTLRPAVALASSLALASAAPAAAQAGAAGRDGGAPPVRYEVRFPNAAHHEAEITATFSGLGSGPLELQMPRSSPGRYALHEFAKNVYGLGARDPRGKALEAERVAPSRWRVTEHGPTVVVRYTLFGDHADGTYDGIDRTHAHLNMPATFLYARGMEDRPIEVDFHPPEGSGWKVATQLVSTADPHRFTAPDLQYFMDSPTEISAFDERSWREPSGDTAYTIRLVVHHRGTAAQVDSFASMARRIVEEEKAVYGELAPYDHGTYTFLADYLPWDFGDGMEHRNSTVLVSRRPLSTGAVRNLGTLAHEFFHSWNMERIRDRAIEPFDFTRADMSGLLWFGEGFTQYYGVLVMERAGFTSRRDYLRRMAGTLDYVLDSPGRRFRGPIGMSRESPFVDAAVSIDQTNVPNTFISYYSYGAVLALALDLQLRTRYGRTLDDYMRAMWREHGKTGVPYTLVDLRETLGEVTGDTAFSDNWFQSYVEGSAAPDFAGLLARAGLLLRPAHPDRATLGPAGLEAADGGVRVTSLTRIGSPLYAAGIEEGDVLTSVGGTPVSSPDAVAAVVAAHAPGDTLGVAFRSRDGEHRSTAVLAADPEREIVPFERAGRVLSSGERALREAWLGSEVREPAGATGG